MVDFGIVKALEVLGARPIRAVQLLARGVASAVHVRDGPCVERDPERRSRLSAFGGRGNGDRGGQQLDDGRVAAGQKEAHVHALALRHSTCGAPRGTCNMYCTFECGAQIVH